MKRLGKILALVLITQQLLAGSALAEHSDETEEGGGWFPFFKKRSGEESAAKAEGRLTLKSKQSGPTRQRRSGSSSYSTALGPLPAWATDGEPTEGARNLQPLGGALWPSQARPLPFGIDFENVIIAEEPLDGAGAEPDFDPVEFAEAALRKAVNEAPQSYLIDPLHLLTEQQSSDIDHQLASHALESPMTVAMLLMPSGHGLPDGLSAQELRRRWFGDEPIMLLVYSLGNPGAAEIVWRNAELPIEAQQAIWASCVRESLVAHDPFHQLERFSFELSVRLYWYYFDDQTGPPGRNAGAPQLAASPVRQWPPEPAPLAVSRWVQENWIASAAGACVVAALILILGLVRLRISRRPILLPDVEICPRLGAPHAGGGHAVIHFGSAAD